MPHGMVTCTEQNSFTQSGNSFSTNFSTQSGANHRCKKRFYIVFYSCHVSKNVLTFSYFATFLYYKKRQRKCNLKQYFFDILHRWLRYLKRKGNAIRGEIIPCRKHRVTDCTDCCGTAHWATTNFFYHVSDVFLFISVCFFAFQNIFFKMFSNVCLHVYVQISSLTGSSQCFEASPGASTPYKRWSKCTMKKIRGEGFCRNLGGEVHKLFMHISPKFLQ